MPECHSKKEPFSSTNAYKLYKNLSLVCMTEILLWNLHGSAYFSLCVHAPATLSRCCILASNWFCCRSSRSCSGVASLCLVTIWFLQCLGITFQLECYNQLLIGINHHYCQSKSGPPQLSGIQSKEEGESCFCMINLLSQVCIMIPLYASGGEKEEAKG